MSVPSDDGLVGRLSTRVRDQRRNAAGGEPRHHRIRAAGQDDGDPRPEDDTCGVGSGEERQAFASMLPPEIRDDRVADRREIVSMTRD
jgi:hypothetical protein